MTQKRFNCPRCPYSTIYADLFLKHLSTHHTDEAEEILCDLITEGKIRIEVT